ncbi:MAG: hypothetical protein MJZ05_09320 [Fibrobacter sp.]|nr:hypothetical protein [Fibrobacter sp.]
MGYIESKCPHCGKVNRFSCNTYAYGSPIVNCKDCHEEFVEKKFREVAVEGFDPRTTNPKFYVKAIPLFLVLSAVCFALQMVRVGELTFNKISVAAVACAAAAVLCLVQFIRIKCGFEDKSNAKHLEESRERLKDKSYAKKLASYGYNVPDEYLK